MNCKRCNEEMQMQTATQTKKRGFFTILLYIILLFIPVVGWIALFALLAGSRKQEAVTFAVCPRCGYREKVS